MPGSSRRRWHYSRSRTWVTTLGWTRDHLLRRAPANDHDDDTTRCGYRIRTALRPGQGPHCRTCQQTLDDPTGPFTPTPRGYTAHRTTTLAGGPLDGRTARIYLASGGFEPKVITLAWVPDRTRPPAAWLDYTRQPDGSYHYQEPPT